MTTGGSGSIPVLTIVLIALLLIDFCRFLITNQVARNAYQRDYRAAFAVESGGVLLQEFG